VKKFSMLFIFVLLISACKPAPQQTTSNPTVAAPAETQIVASATPTVPPTNTPAPTDPPTATPTFTLVPTETNTPTPAPTPLGGGGGNLMMMVNINVVNVPQKSSSDFEIIVPSDDIKSEFDIEDFSSLRTDDISPNGEIVAVWNCAYDPCDTKRGPMYLFTTDFKQKATIDVVGFPDFLGYSANQDRMLYYLSGTMADDYYLVKTEATGFGEVIHLGRISSVVWAPDRQTLYSQKGNKVTQLDKDGKELQTWTCDFSNACAAAPSPDGKRFAGIKKFVPTSGSNPIITISNKDFTEKKSIFLQDDHALILYLMWLPDSQHILVSGMSSKQSNRRFWRMDYLSMIDVDTEEEQRIDLQVPEDSESFFPCGLSPDSQHMIYLSTGGRVTEGGRIYMSGRFAMMFPITTEGTPELTRMTDFSEAWESCPVWLPATAQ
jgi:hypothetical protein